MTTAGPARSWRSIGVLLAVIFAVGLSAVAVAWRHSSGGNSTSQDSCAMASVTAEVDLRAAVGTDQPEQLPKTADILRHRLSAYGCSTVTVDGDLLHVSTSAAGEAHLAELAQPGELEFREVTEALARKPTGCLVALSPLAGTPITACSKDGSEQYDLGPAKILSADIKGATAQHDQQLGEWQVIVKFTPEGQRKWTALTRDTVGKRLAMVLDGYVISAPTIEEQIDGDAQITGSFTEASAKALASTLEYGPLPIRLQRA